MASKTRPPYNKEDEIGQRWDRCISDLFLKLGGGLIIGATASYIFCNRKKWPIALATGFAVGMAYCNCERDLNLAVAPSCNPTPKTMYRIHPVVMRLPVTPTIQTTLERQGHTFPCLPK